MSSYTTQNDTIINAELDVIILSEISQIEINDDESRFGSNSDYKFRRFNLNKDTILVIIRKLTYRSEMITVINYVWREIQNMYFW